MWRLALSAWLFYASVAQAEDSDRWVTSGAAVIDEQGRVLLIKVTRETERDGTNGWTLPKGRVDDGETKKEAGAREVEEEGGTKSELSFRILLYKSRNADRYYYLAKKVSSGELSEKGVEERRWLKPKKALRLLQRKRDRAVVKAARNALKKARKSKNR